MKVFQIFDHAHAPIAPYLGYMERVRDLAESYTLIAPANFMGPGVSFVPIEDVRAELPDYMIGESNGLYRFDALRAWYLSRNFGSIYLDIDIDLRGPLEIGPIPRFEGPGVLLGNGDAVLGLACWETYLRLSPAFCRPASLMFADCREARNLEDEDKMKFIHRFAAGKYFKQQAAKAAADTTAKAAADAQAKNPKAQ